MKFGKNLQDLSIPEWKNYNLDYNELKSIIKQLNINHSTDIKELYKEFVENFNTINLFIITKYGEIYRKFEFLSNNFETIIKSTPNESNSIIMKQYKLEILLSNLIDVSIILKKLSKFILIQKIAVKKIFKKFLKHYFDKDISQQLLLKLKSKLNKDPKSFVNFNLLELTIKLTNLINLVKFEIKNDLQHENTNNNGSASNAANSSPETTAFLNSVNSLNLTDALKFDLNCYVKKNFELDFLIPDDFNNLNEILLNFNIYLNLNNLSNTASLYSLTYLQNDDNVKSQPSYILSQCCQPYSLIISYIGGLRKFSYCSLPNNIVNKLLNYLKDLNNVELKDDLKYYFHNSNITSLTKLTIESILNNALKPKAKIFYRRNSYYLSKADINEDVDELNKTSQEDDYLISLSSDVSTTNEPKYLYDIDFKDQVKFLERKQVKNPNQNNQQLCPSQQQDDSDVQEELFDIFPFNVLQVHSNDSNLVNFEKNLLTEIDENNVLSNKYSNNLLNKLPLKIQKIVKNNNSINLFKNFNFYEYCISCYYNISPHNLNNHYSNILKLNLFKSFENTEIFNNELSYQQSILKVNEDKKLKNQLSLNDLEKQIQIQENNLIKKEKYDKYVNSKILFDPEALLNNQQSLNNPHNNNVNKKRPNLPKNDSIATLSSYNLSIFTDKDKLNNHSPNYEELDEMIAFEDNESLKLFWKDSDNNDNFFNQYNNQYNNKYNEFLNNDESYKNSNINNFINNLISLKSKLNSNSNTQLSSKPLINSRNNSNANLTDYQSINSESSFDVVNYYHEYNKFISFFYFVLNFISIFISGIELGIIFSILQLSKLHEGRFILFNNLWLFFILIIGILISLISSILSINLIFKRISRPPTWHYLFILLGIGLVVICCLFILIVLTV